MTEQHVYRSTGCFHGEHEYCKSMTGQHGEKRPGRCKFCDARCICLCHDVDDLVAVSLVPVNEADDTW